MPGTPHSRRADALATRRVAVAAGALAVLVGVGAAVALPDLVEGRQRAEAVALAERTEAAQRAADAQEAAERAAAEAAAEERGQAIRTAHARITAAQDAAALTDVTTTLAGHLPDASLTLGQVRAALDPPRGLSDEQDPADSEVASALAASTTEAVAGVTLWQAVAAQPFLRAPANGMLEGVVQDLPDATRAAAEALESWTSEREVLLARVAAEREAAQASADAGPGSGGESRARGTAGTSGGAGSDCGGAGSREASSSSGVVFYTSTPSEEGDGSNGRIPRHRMTALDWCRDSQGNAQWLRSDAAAALVRLNAAFRERFGENIAIDLSYRSYETQVAMREHYGSLAARPGTSNHGWGTAFDTWEWAAYSFGSARYEWLVANGPAYGWVAPSWARQGGSNPEYWHFEFVG